jgi:FtsZ-interacting cell division protein ZipA
LTWCGGDLKLALSSSEHCLAAGALDPSKTQIPTADPNSVDRGAEDSTPVIIIMVVVALIGACFAVIVIALLKVLRRKAMRSRAKRMGGTQSIEMSPSAQRKGATALIEQDDYTTFRRTENSQYTTNQSQQRQQPPRQPQPERQYPQYQQSPPQRQYPQAHPPQQESYQYPNRHQLQPKFEVNYQPSHDPPATAAAAEAANRAEPQWLSQQQRFVPPPRPSLFHSSYDEGSTIRDSRQ